MKIASTVLRRVRAGNYSYLFNIKAFKRVGTLYGSMNYQEIARTLDMSEFLVKEYIAIIEEFNKKKGKINDSRTYAVNVNQLYLA